MAKLTEIADKSGASLEDARKALQDLRQSNKLPSPSATLSDVEASQLQDLLKGDQAPVVEKEAKAAQNNEDLLRVIEELKSRLDRVESGELSTEAQDQLQARIHTLESAVKPGNTNLRKGVRGRTIEVKRGDLIAYDHRLWPAEVVQGGWRKATGEDERTSRDVPVVGVAMKDFTYDDACGAPMHSVTYRAYRQFYKRRGGDVLVGPRDPEAQVAVS